jgi:hypothetical protein
VFSPGARWKLQVVLTRDAAATDEFGFQIFSQRMGDGTRHADAASWTLNVAGRLRTMLDEPSAMRLNAAAIEAIQSRCLDEAAHVRNQSVAGG